MRTGQLARLLTVSDQTIINWINRPEIAKFMSPTALGEEGIQREFTESDVLVLNTVEKMRTDEIFWDKIAERLESGDRETEFPVTAALTDSRTIPMHQAKQAAELAIVSKERDLALVQLSDVRSQLFEAREEGKELREKYEKLLREVGKLEGMVEILRSKPS